MKIVGYSHWVIAQAVSGLVALAAMLHLPALDPSVLDVLAVVVTLGIFTFVSLKAAGR